GNIRISGNDSYATGLTRATPMPIGSKNGARKSNAFWKAQKAATKSLTVNCASADSACAWSSKKFPRCSEIFFSGEAHPFASILLSPLGRRGRPSFARPPADPQHSARNLRWSNRRKRGLPNRRSRLSRLWPADSAQSRHVWSAWPCLCLLHLRQSLVLQHRLPAEGN